MVRLLLLVRWSDLSAVAIAGAIGADACEIYSDVDGDIYKDPRVEPRAKRISYISSDEDVGVGSFKGGPKFLNRKIVCKNLGLKTFANVSAFLGAEQAP